VEKSSSDFKKHEDTKTSTKSVLRQLYIKTLACCNTEIAKELNITPVLDKIQSYKRNWIQHANRMPCSRLPRILKNCTPKGRRTPGRPMKRLLDK
jgi:hypothetical protein